MQIIPAFAYLMPVVILFSVGPGAAVITTMIYAVPPAVRITVARHPRRPGEHGRGGHGARLDAVADCCGRCSSRSRGGMLLLSVNQTILFALSMVVIAGLIDTAAASATPSRTACTPNPALAILAGVAIVIMAIALDRVTEAIAERTDPATTAPRPTAAAAARRASRPAPSRPASPWQPGSAYLFSAGDVYSRWTAQDWLLARVQSVLDYVQNPNTFLFTTSRTRSGTSSSRTCCSRSTRSSSRRRGSSRSSASSRSRTS